MLDLRNPRGSCWDHRGERWIARAHHWHIYKLSVYEDNIDALEEFLLTAHAGHLFTTLLVDEQRHRLHAGKNTDLGHLLAFSDPQTAMLFRLSFVGEPIE